jgi:thiol-disulfide isomerase/thioredoxin
VVLRAIVVFYFFFSAPYLYAGLQFAEIADLQGLQVLNEKNFFAKVESGKEKIVYFWATWCEVCKSKLTTTLKQDDLYKKYDVYLVATDQNKEKIEHFQKKFGVKPYVVLDSDRRLQKKFDIVGVPTVIRLKPDQGRLIVTSLQSGGEMDQLLR